MNISEKHTHFASFRNRGIKLTFILFAIGATSAEDLMIELQVLTQVASIISSNLMNFRQNSGTTVLKHAILQDKAFNIVNPTRTKLLNSNFQ
jgi:hypothetical protein